MVLDGRHRYKACRELGIDCPTNVYAGPDPLAFVLSMNLHRRHLTESQRALVAAKVANMRHGEFHGNQHTEVSANLPVAPVSQAEAAKLLNVTERLVRDAVKVKEEAPVEVVEQVERGELTVTAAKKTIAEKTGASSKKPKKDAGRKKPEVTGRSAADVVADIERLRGVLESRRRLLKSCRARPYSSPSDACRSGAVRGGVTLPTWRGDQGRLGMSPPVLEAWGSLHV